MDEKLREIIEQKKEKIAKKGADMSNLDLYNLCVLNKLTEKDTDQQEGEQ